MFLSNLLNADITPLLPAGASDAQVATALFTVMAGHGACLYSVRSGWPLPPANIRSYALLHRAAPCPLATRWRRRRSRCWCRR